MLKLLFQIREKDKNRSPLEQKCYIVSLSEPVVQWSISATLKFQFEFGKYSCFWLKNMGRIPIRGNQGTPANF